jgi:histidinol-phosphate aminotransferase
MPDRSPSDAIKPEVRAASAYTLKHVAAEVKLDQNENPFELPQEFKEEVARRVVARQWGRYPEFVPAAMSQALAKYTGWPEEGILVGNRVQRIASGGAAGHAGTGTHYCNSSTHVYAVQAAVFHPAGQHCHGPLRPADLSYDVDALAQGSGVRM